MSRAADRKIRDMPKFGRKSLDMGRKSLDTHGATDYEIWVWIRMRRDLLRDFSLNPDFPDSNFPDRRYQIMPVPDFSTMVAKVARTPPLSQRPHRFHYGCRKRAVPTLVAKVTPSLSRLRKSGKKVWSRRQGCRVVEFSVVLFLSRVVATLVPIVAPSPFQSRNG